MAASMANGCGGDQCGRPTMVITASGGGDWWQTLKPPRIITVSLFLKNIFLTKIESKKKYFSKN